MLRARSAFVNSFRWFRRHFPKKCEQQPCGCRAERTNPI